MHFNFPSFAPLTLLGHSIPAYLVAFQRAIKLAIDPLIMRNYQLHCGHFTKPANCVNVRLQGDLDSQSTVTRSKGIRLNSKRSVRLLQWNERNRITTCLNQLKQVKENVKQVKAALLPCISIS